jgi:hypothetical protein
MYLFPEVFPYEGTRTCVQYVRAYVVCSYVRKYNYRIDTSVRVQLKILLYGNTFVEYFRTKVRKYESTLFRSTCTYEIKYVATYVIATYVLPEVLRSPTCTARLASDTTALLLH